MVFLTLCLVLIAAVQLICLLALVDQYRGLLQIRESLGLVDQAEPIELPEAATRWPPSAIGLPEHLDREDRVVIAFLSTKCMTCQILGRAMGGSVPAGMRLVMVGPSPESCDQWLSEMGLSGERIVVDDGMRIAGQLQLDVFPAALVYDRGSLSRPDRCLRSGS